MKKLEMTGEDIVVLALLRAALSGEPADESLLEKLTAEQWAGVFRQGVRQGVSAMIFDALSSSPAAAAMPKALALKWMAGTVAVEGRYARQKAVGGEISRLLAAEGLGVPVLKGLALARLYPRPEHRECGDIDIYSGERHSAVDAVLARAGADVEDDYYVHSHISFKGVTIENHRFFNPVRGSRSRKELERHFIELMNGCGTVTQSGGQVAVSGGNASVGALRTGGPAAVSDGNAGGSAGGDALRTVGPGEASRNNATGNAFQSGEQAAVSGGNADGNAGGSAGGDALRTGGQRSILGCVPGTMLVVPPADFTALFLTQHALKHFVAEGGIRLRHLADWTVFLNAEQDDVDWAQFYLWADKMHFSRFADAMTALSVKYLGLKVTAAGLRDESRYADAVLEDILHPGAKSGNKGGSTLIMRLNLALGAFRSLWKYHRIYRKSAFLEVFTMAAGLLFDRNPRL